MQPFSEEAQNFRLEKLSDTLRVFKQYYTFSEIEIQTAPLLYKYIIAIEYAAIKDFEKNWMDDRKIHLLFDSIEHMLLRNDIDFKRILC